jgi:hypothetical protein
MGYKKTHLHTLRLTDGHFTSPRGLASYLGRALHPCEALDLLPRLPDSPTRFGVQECDVRFGQPAAALSRSMLRSKPHDWNGLGRVRQHYRLSIFNSVGRQWRACSFGCAAIPVLGIRDLIAPKLPLATQPKTSQGRSNSQIELPRLTNWNRCCVRVLQTSPIGIWWRNRHRSLRLISASVGEWLRRRFRLAAAQVCARRTRCSAIGSADGAISR